jgi:hypothetical protein
VKTHERSVHSTPHMKWFSARKGAGVGLASAMVLGVSAASGQNPTAVTMEVSGDLKAPAPQTVLYTVPCTWGLRTGQINNTTAQLGGQTLATCGEPTWATNDPGDCSVLVPYLTYNKNYDYAAANVCAFSLPVAPGTSAQQTYTTKRSGGRSVTTEVIDPGVTGQVRLQCLAYSDYGENPCGPVGWVSPNDPSDLRCTVRYGSASGSGTNYSPFSCTVIIKYETPAAKAAADAAYAATPESATWVMGSGSPLERFTGSVHDLSLNVPASRTTSSSDITDLKISVQTGSDDLRGGSHPDDNADATIRLVSGATMVTTNINAGRRWGNSETHVAALSIPPHTRVSDIAGVTLHTHFDGGISGDNWNVNSVALVVDYPRGAAAPQAAPAAAPVARPVFAVPTEPPHPLAAPAPRVAGAPDVITVTKARIGCLDIQTDGNLTGLVSQACNGKSSCAYKAPTESEYKRAGVQARTRTFCTQGMDIEYRCNDGRSKSSSVPGDAWNHPPADLSCAN